MFHDDFFSSLRKYNKSLSRVTDCDLMSRCPGCPGIFQKVFIKSYSLDIFLKSSQKSKKCLDTWTRRRDAYKEGRKDVCVSFVCPE